MLKIRGGDLIGRVDLQSMILQADELNGPDSPEFIYQLNLQIAADRRRGRLDGGDETA